VPHDNLIVAVGIRRVILLLAVVVLSGWALSSGLAATPQHHSGRTQANHHPTGETNGSAEQAPAIESAPSADAAAKADSQVHLVGVADCAPHETVHSNHSSIALPFVLSRPFDPAHHHTFSLLI